MKYIKIIRQLCTGCLLFVCMASFGETIQQFLSDGKEQMVIEGREKNAALAFLQAYKLLDRTIYEVVEGRLTNYMHNITEDTYFKRGNTTFNARIIMGAWFNDSLNQKSQNWLGLSNQFSSLDLGSKTFIKQFSQSFQKDYNCCCTPSRSGIEWLGMLFCGMIYCCYECDDEISTHEPGGMKYEIAKSKAYRKHVEEVLYCPMRKVICKTLKCETLPKAGEFWQENFCKPVSILLQKLCEKPPAAVSIADLSWFLYLYKSYVESDCGIPMQNHFAQYDFETTRERVHAFLVKLICSPESDKHVKVFLTKSIGYWINNAFIFVDEVTIPGEDIRPIGFYQIELLLLGENFLKTLPSLPLPTSCITLQKHYHELLKIYQRELVRDTALGPINANTLLKNFYVKKIHTALCFCFSEAKTAFLPFPW